MVFTGFSRSFRALFTLQDGPKNQNNGLEKNALDLAICNWTCPLGRFAFFLLYWLSTHAS
jgi:hypothetical protein